MPSGPLAAKGNRVRRRRGFPSSGVWGPARKGGEGKSMAESIGHDEEIGRIRKYGRRNQTEIKRWSDK
jgi:hypothetical protein